MKTGKHFVVVKKLESKIVNSNTVSNDFDIDEIAKRLGDIAVDPDASHIKYENGDIFLVIVRRENGKTDPKVLQQLANML
jgi:hypothetical protein